MKKIYFIICILFVSFAASAATFPVTASTTPSGNCGAASGTIIITPAGGVPPYSYALNGGAYQASNIFTNLVGGIYTVEVVDLNGDTGSATVTITVSPAPVVSATATNATCAGNDGIITVAATAGIAPFEYSIDGCVTFQSTPVFNNVSTGTYMICVRDASLCVTQITVSVFLDNNISMTVGPDVTICDGSSVQLTATGTGSGNYFWSPAAGLNNPAIANPIASPASNTIYAVTYAVGLCTIIDSVHVNVDYPWADAGNDTAICAGGNAFLNVTGTGASGLIWSPAAGLSNVNVINPTASPAVTTAYIAALTDAAGCVAYDTVVVNVISITDPVIALNTGVLSVTNPDVNAVYTWQVLNGSVWDDVVPAQHGTSFTPSSTANYRVMAVINSCTAYSSSQLAGRPASTNQYGIYLYPNPSTNRFTLDAIQLSQSWEMLEITNAQGVRVLSRNIRNQSSVSVDIAALGRGVYTARLSAADGKTTVIRFVKE